MELIAVSNTTKPKMNNKAAVHTADVIRYGRYAAAAVPRCEWEQMARGWQGETCYPFQTKRLTRYIRITDKYSGLHW